MPKERGIMIDLKKEIKGLERSLSVLYEKLGQIPAPLLDGATAGEVRNLIDRVEKKISILKREQRRFW